MSNVLPKENLKTQWNRFKSRLIFVGALVLLTAAALSGLAFLPAHLAIQVEKNIAAQTGEKGSATLSGADKRAREIAELTRAQALLDALSNVLKASSPTAAIESALALRPGGILIERISFVDSENSITLGGVSQGRDSLNRYKEALAKDKLFKNVSVPVGTLVSAEEGRFTITVSSAF